MSMKPLEIRKDSTNTFYSDCRTYFLALQKQGKTDDGFEDEFFFTMPAISGNA